MSRKAIYISNDKKIPCRILESKGNRSVIEVKGKKYEVSKKKLSEAFVRDWSKGDVISFVGQFEDETDFKSWLIDANKLIEEGDKIIGQLINLENRHDSRDAFSNGKAGMYLDVERMRLYRQDVINVAKQKFKFN